MALVTEYLNKKRSHQLGNFCKYLEDTISDTDELFEEPNNLRGLISFTHLLGFNLSASQSDYVYVNDIGKYQTGYVSSYLDPTTGKESTSLIKHVFSHYQARPYNTTYKNIALPEFPGSNILCLDIDTHVNKDLYSLMPSKYEQILTYLHLTYDCYPLYVEASLEHRGLHVYYKTNANNIHKTLMAEVISKDLKLKFGRYITSVDIRNENRKIRLPFASDYDCLDVITHKFIDEDDAVKNCFRNIEEDDRLLDYNLLYLDNKKYFDTRLGIDTDEVTSVWMREVSSSGPVDFTFTEGNRVGGEGKFFSFTFYCIAKGFSKEEYYFKAYEFNESSKDLTAWLGRDQYQLTPEGKKQLDKIYDWCLQKYNSSKRKNAKFKSNIEFKKPELTSLQKKIIIKYVKKFNYEDRLVYENILTEILLRVNYEKINPRRVNKKIALTQKLKDSLSLGYQFPRKFQDYVKEKYSIKGNIYIMFNEILYDTNLFNQLITSKRGYLYGEISSCRQFELNSHLLYTILKRYSSVTSTSKETLFKIPPPYTNILLCVSYKADICFTNKNTS